MQGNRLPVCRESAFGRVDALQGIARGQHAADGKVQLVLSHGGQQSIGLHRSDGPHKGVGGGSPGCPEQLPQAERSSQSQGKRNGRCEREFAARVAASGLYGRGLGGKVIELIAADGRDVWRQIMRFVAKSFEHYLVRAKQGLCDLMRTEYGSRANAARAQAILRALHGGSAVGGFEWCGHNCFFFYTTMQTVNRQTQHGLGKFSDQTQR